MSESTVGLARRMSPRLGALALALAGSLVIITGCTAAPASSRPVTTGPRAAPATTAGPPSGPDSPSVAPSPASTDTPSPSSTDTPSTTPGATAPVAVDKILLIMEENRSVTDVGAHLPYLTSQGHRYGSATAYDAITHPSLPNYLAIAGGSTFGVRDDEDPDVHPISGHSVFGELLAGGHTAKAYADGMPTNCATRNHGDYAVRHNPWAYFANANEKKACRQLDVPAGSPTHGALADDIAAGRLPDFGLLVPDVCHDGHDCSGAVTDRWLTSWLPTIKNGPDFTSGRLVVIITWDEDDDHSGNRVPLVVLHPSLDGRTVHAGLDHYALSGTILRMAGRKPLREGAGTPDLLTAFGLR